MSAEGLAFHLISVHNDPMAIACSYQDNLREHKILHSRLKHRTHNPDVIFWGDAAVEEVLEDYERRTLPRLGRHPGA